MKKQILILAAFVSLTTQAQAKTDYLVGTDAKLTCSFGSQAKEFVEEFGEAYMTSQIPFDQALKMANKNLADRLKKILFDKEGREAADAMFVVDDGKAAACITTFMMDTGGSNNISEERFKATLELVEKQIELNRASYDKDDLTSDEENGKLLNEFIFKNRGAVAVIINAFSGR